MFKIIMSLILIVNFSFAIEENKIESETKNTIDFILKTIKNKEQNSKEIIFQKIEKIFDFNLMSKISIGKKWSDFSKEEQKIYKEVFVNKLKNSLFSISSSSSIQFFAPGNGGER